MKLGAPLACFLLLSYACRRDAERLEKTLENGVEVVINHLEPYKVKGESPRLEVEQELVIDTEREEISTRGLSDVAKFDIVFEGNTYLFQRAPKGLSVVF